MPFLRLSLSLSRFRCRLFLAMFNQYLSTVLVTVVSLSYTVASAPSVYSASPSPEPVLYSWSKDPSCRSTATKSGCQTAAAQVCAADLRTSTSASVRGCTAWYWYDVNNTVPIGDQCMKAFSSILASGIGGAVGYDALERRTKDPIYAIFPANGNGNCFKKLEDNSPPLPTNEFPDGKTLSTCPTSSSKRQDTQLLEDRQSSSANGSVEEAQSDCRIEKRIWGYSCSAICLTSVVTTSWV